MQEKIKILIVDDEAIIRDSLRDWLTDAGHEVFIAENGDEALELVRQEKPTVAVVDLILPGTDGLEIMKKARQILPTLHVIIITAFSSIPTAINAIKEGAYDYIEKPFAPEKLELLINRIIRSPDPSKGTLSMRQKMQERYSFENIVAKSPRMQKIVEMIKVVSKSAAPVIICGESGTGKEVVAHAIHNQSYRRNKTFIAVSCAALPETIIESEMFGHESGAFSGALAMRKGKFEVANGGSLFLDEVGSLGSNFQVHLLRALEQKAFFRIGGNELIKTDIRLISATNKDMRAAIEAGHFREDLYYRLGVVNIELPALRERKEDIPILAEIFLIKFNEENHRNVTGFSQEASEFLLRYEWPGNVRELENAIERAVIMAKGDRIEITDLSLQSLYMQHRVPVGKTMREVEKNHIYNVLVESNGNCSEAARILDISRMTLYNKIKAYGLDVNKVNE